MRTEAKQAISDICFDEAGNDGITRQVIEAQLFIVDRIKGGKIHKRAVDISPSLAYMLVDVLELGVNVQSGTKQEILLELKYTS